tara:strand:+ start:126 stop:515 length:390 start_codon:yes stop_codon:yes gene_type:complete
MKYFQLFCGTPSNDFMESLLVCYGLRGFQDNTEFCKNDLIEHKTIEKLEELLPEMVMYYIPCKAKIYLNDINEKRAITVLTQFLKLFGYRMLRKERLVSKKKVIYYKIQKTEDTKLHIDNSNTYELLFK